MESKFYSTPTTKNKGAETSQVGNVAPGGHPCREKFDASLVRDEHRPGNTDPKKT
jgi:hypothetical protein